jgi:Zn finger protein HypA/HybF involved in hydrogenase expression
MRKREKLEKQCLYCNKKIPNRNVYCGNKCQGDYKTKLIFENIEKGDKTLYVNNYRNYLILKYGEKCMDCGWCEINPITNKVPIQLEHIDGNSENNSLDNLKILCPNCHSLTPTFGALNKGNGRELRRIKRQEKK